MLLIIEALLLVLAALGQDHSAAAAATGQIFPLDMAPDSFDDYYSGCRGEMATQVKTKYLKQEIKRSDYRRSWELGKNFVKFAKDHLSRNHLIAIYVYSENTVRLYKQFNTDTRKIEKKKFAWYSLHFLLTEAIQILRKTRNECYTTYRSTTVEFYKDVLNTEVRFGSFTSSYLDRNVAKGYGGKSCFEIYTCEGADLTNYSALPHEKLVLIPPYEKFNVTAVEERGKQKDLWCETVFTLKSSGTVSYQNCAVLADK